MNKEDVMNIDGDPNMRKYVFESGRVVLVARVEGEDDVRRCDRVHEAFKDNLYDWIKMMREAGALVFVK